MKNFTKHDLLLAAYDELSQATPKKYDCGLLCDSLCCAQNQSHGDEDDCGMLLLPGEKELLTGEAGFRFIDRDDGTTLLVCQGTCLRDLRPFACRIFPFYPKIQKTGKRLTIQILPDPRSRNVCPIMSDFRKRKTNILFLRAAKKATRILLRDEDIKKELMSQSEMISDIEKLRELIFKNK